MRFSAVLTLTALVVVGAQAQEPEAPKPATEHPADFATALDRTSYAVGYSFGSSFHNQNVELTTEQVVAGLRDGLRGEGGRLSDEDATVLARQLQNMIMRQKQEETAAAATQNRADGEAFLATNRDREGVVSLASGLQYEVLHEGSGATPAADDLVRMHYRGWLIDGTEFDSSYDRGEPTTLRPAMTMLGFAEAIPMMPVGSTWKLFIPSDLAFGDRGLGNNIPPGATLIYELELQAIETEDEPAAGAGPQS